MDFLFGILLIIIVILLLFNFASISISNKPFDGTCSSIYKPYQDNSILQNQSISGNVPQPSNNSNKVLNGKMSLEQQSYDYQKIFYM